MDWSNFPSLIWDADRPLYRIHRRDHHPAWFGASGKERFDPPPALRADFGTCYTGASPESAYVEAFGRLKAAVPVHIITERRLAVFKPRKNLRLADMNDPSILGLYRIDASASIGPVNSYRTNQRYAGELWSAGFDGIHYLSRHDPSLTSVSVAVFAKPGEHPAKFRDYTYQEIADTNLIETRWNRYRISVELLPRLLP
jgi:hypothetical protein